MRVVILLAALREMSDASAYYDERSDSAGDEFFEAAQQAFEEIGHRPLMHPKVTNVRLRREYRSLLLDRFPYEIVYALEVDHAVVVAVAHTSRKPGYWRRRLP